MKTPLTRTRLLACAGALVLIGAAIALVRTGEPPAPGRTVSADAQPSPTGPVSRDALRRGLAPDVLSESTPPTTALVPAQGAPVAQPPSPALRTIRGRVVSSRTGSPLSHTVVWARTAGGSGAAVRQARGDSEGRFELGLPRGLRASLTALAPDHLPVTIPPAALESAGDVDIGTVALAPGAFADVEVMDAATETPLAGVVVRVTGPADEASPAGGPRGTTGRHGRARVGPVAPEGAELRLSRPGFATVRTAWRASDATPVRVRLTPTVAAAGDAPGAHHPGLGIRGRGGQVTVTTVVAGSAAEQAGVVAGARLVSVDGVPAADLPPDRVFALLQGPPDSNVTVELRLPTEREVRRLTLARR